MNQGWWLQLTPQAGEQLAGGFGVGCATHSTACPVHQLPVDVARRRGDEILGEQQGFFFLFPYKNAQFDTKA